MGLAVVTVASGGLAVVQTAGGSLAVTEAANLRGVPVTKGTGGLPVTFVTEAGVVVPPVSAATWDPATVTAVTLSGGNRVATNTGTTATEQGAKVASASGKTSGKYYFELTLTTKIGAGGGNVGGGIGTFASTYTGMGNNGATGAMVFFGPGNIYSNGSSAGVGIPAILQDDLTGIAIDLDNRRIWFRKGVAGLWNNGGANNPVTNVGGVVIPAGGMVPFVTFGGGSGTAGNVTTANFGASAFAGAVPAGFTAGWPA